MSLPHQADLESSIFLRRILDVGDIASSSNPEASAILVRIATVAQSFEKEEPRARESLVELSLALIAALELPSEIIQRIGWDEPARAAYCRIALDLKLFEHLKEGGENGTSASGLAEKIGADVSLVTRILKHLTAMHITKERSAGIYIATPCSNAFIEPHYRDSIIYTYNVSSPCFHELPDYLRSTHYRDFMKLANGPFQFAHKTRLSFFDWLDQNPPYRSVFNNCRRAYRAGKRTWCDPGFYPISDRLIAHFDSRISDVLLVDVGGGQGRGLQELRMKYPLVPGKLILQDRTEVISAIPADSRTGFICMTHDIFMPQPIKHARAYYLHSALHDWGDDDYIRILTNLKPALKSGYSKILLNEIVVSEPHADVSATSMNEQMLIPCSMHERTASQWHDLLQRAGLRVVSIWTHPGAAESLIEVKLADLVGRGQLATKLFE